MNEIWKDIVGYEGLYQISNLGRVKRLAHWKNQKTDRSCKYTRYRMLKEKILKTSGVIYKSVQLTKDHVTKNLLVHRLVAKAFIPNPENLPEINHKDCDPTNNATENLEWCDRKYNVNYGDRTQLAAEKCKKRVYCVEQDKIYDSVKEASEANNLLKSKISNVCHGKRNTTGGLHWCFVE